jgi:sugar lactone lactonase YvrE
MDSQGRLFVADRGNNRIQIFDQDGNYLDQWTQFSRISGLFIDRAHDDLLYAADSESGSVNPAHGAWARGIRIGSARDGSVKWFIPDSWKTCVDGQRPTPEQPCANNTSSAEGITVDRAGNIYGAEVGQKAIKKYVRIERARR